MKKSILLCTLIFSIFLCIGCKDLSKSSANGLAFLEILNDSDYTISEILIWKAVGDRHTGISSTRSLERSSIVPHGFFVAEFPTTTEVHTIEFMVENSPIVYSFNPPWVETSKIEREKSRKTKGINEVYENFYELRLTINSNLEVRTKTGIVPVEKRLYSDSNRSELATQIEDSIQARVDLEIAKQTELWDSIIDFSKKDWLWAVWYEGNTKKELRKFESVDALLAAIGISLPPEKWGDLIGYIETDVNHEEEMNPVWDNIFSKYEALETELPAAPSSIVAAQFKDVVEENKDFIIVNGISISKTDYNHLEELFYYAGIIPTYHGKKGVLSRYTTLWGADSKSGGKPALLYRSPNDSDSRRGKAYLAIVKAALQEISNATGNVVTYREVRNSLETRGTSRYLHLGYCGLTNGDTAARTVGADLGAFLHINTNSSNEPYSYFVDAIEWALGEGLFDMVELFPGSSLKTLRLYQLDSAKNYDFTRINQVYTWMGIIQKELLHSFGLLNEELRFDRQLYISYDGDKKKAIHSKNSTAAYTPNYDYLSITHGAINSSKIANNLYSYATDDEEKIANYTGMTTLSESDKSFLASIYGGEKKSSLDKLLVLQLRAGENLSKSYIGRDLGLISNGDSFMPSNKGAGAAFKLTGINFKESLNRDEVVLSPFVVAEDIDRVEMELEWFYGQKIVVMQNGLSYAVSSSPLVVLDILPGKNDITIEVRSEDGMRVTTYLLPIYRPTTALHSITVSGFSDKTDRLQTYFMDTTPHIICEGVSDSVRLTFDCFAGERLTINGTTIEVDEKKLISYDVSMAGAYEKLISIDVSFPLVDATYGSTSYSILLRKFHAIAELATLRVNYSALDENGNSKDFNNNLIESDNSFLFIHSKKGAHLRFSLTKKDLSAQGKEQQLFVCSYPGTASMQEKAYAELKKVPIDDPLNFNYFLPLNKDVELCFIVVVDDKINRYPIRLYCYKYIEYTFNCDGALKLNAQTYLHQKPFSVALSSPGTFKMPTTPGGKIYLRTPGGYTSVIFAPGKYSTAENVFIPVFDEDTPDSRSVTVSLKPTNPFVESVRFTGEFKGNQGDLVFFSDGSFSTKSAQGNNSIIYIYLKKESGLSFPYRVYKGENQGGGILLLDILENSNNYDNPTYPRLGRGFLGNGYFPSTSGWYTLQNVKDNSFIMARLKQDVTQNVAVQVKLVFSYNPPASF